MNEPPIQVSLDAANPGHVFACCGLLELADRCWRGAEGWFTDDTFRLRPLQDSVDANAAELLAAITSCPLANAMTEEQRSRRDELAAMPKKARHEALEAEKKRLDALYRESPVWIGKPFNLRLNWFLDQRSGGKELKTWAGQQSVIDIANGMRRLLDPGASTEDWLFRSIPSEAVPFNFDSNLGNAGSDLDLGFSIDPLKPSGLVAQIRPFPEFAAFVGLQRFRPEKIGRGVYGYSVWTEPLLPEAAAALVSGSIDSLVTRRFQFRLLYRTKYLKSFLPAKAVD